MMHLLSRVSWIGLCAVLVLGAEVAWASQANLEKEFDRLQLSTEEKEGWIQVYDALNGLVQGDMPMPPEFASVFGDEFKMPDLLTGLKVADMICGGQYNDAAKESGKYLIGKFSPGFGSYVIILEAEAMAIKGILANWVADLDDHPAYHGVREELHNMVMRGPRVGDPYLPSYLCGGHTEVRAIMQRKEQQMFDAWMENEKYNVRQLFLAGWASRIRQKYGKDLTEREIFNQFLIQAVQDQKAQIWHIFERVSTELAALEARKNLAKKLYVKLNPVPSKLKVAAFRDKARATKFLVGKPIGVAWQFKVGPRAKCKVTVEITGPNGSPYAVLGEEMEGRAPADGNIYKQKILGEIKEPGKYKVILGVENCRDHFERKITEIEVVDLASVTPVQHVVIKWDPRKDGKRMIAAVKFGFCGAPNTEYAAAIARSINGRVEDKEHIKAKTNAEGLYKGTHSFGAFRSGDWKLAFAVTDPQGKVHTDSLSFSTIDKSKVPKSDDEWSNIVGPHIQQMFNKLKDLCRRIEEKGNRLRQDSNALTDKINHIAAKVTSMNQARQSASQQYQDGNMEESIYQSKYGNNGSIAKEAQMLVDEAAQYRSRQAELEKEMQALTAEYLAMQEYHNVVEREFKRHVAAGLREALSNPLINKTGMRSQLQSDLDAISADRGR